jgi:hypothetical protein
MDGFEVLMYEERGVLGCNAMWFGESPTSQMNILPPPSSFKA